MKYTQVALLALALGANALIAVAKTVVAVITGSASMVAEAAHSWADAGNEIFLLIAERRSRRPPSAAGSAPGKSADRT